MAFFPFEQLDTISPRPFVIAGSKADTLFLEPGSAREGQAEGTARHRRRDAQRHFLMSDLNNVQIADLLSQYLAEKKLD